MEPAPDGTHTRRSQETSQAAATKLSEATEFYIPRVSRHVLPLDAPIQLTRFAARFRAVFDADPDTPKRLGLAEHFGHIADYLHINICEPGTDTWRFGRFAPAWAARLGQDLAGEEVTHAAYAPFNTRLLDMLGEAAARNMPFYAATYIGQGDTTQVARLLIPVSTSGLGVTHCLVCTA